MPPSKQKEPKEEVDGGSEEHKATSTFVAEGPMLVGAYTWGEIAFGTPNLHGWSYRLCIGATTTMTTVALVTVRPTL